MPYSQRQDQLNAAAHANSTKPASQTVPQPHSAKLNDDQRWNAVVGARLRARRRVRLRRLHHRRVLPAFVPGAPSAARECDVLSRVPSRRRKPAFAPACVAGQGRSAAIRNRTAQKRSAATSSSISMSRSRSNAWAKHFSKALSICSGASRRRSESRRANTPIPAACACSNAICKREIM